MSSRPLLCIMNSLLTKCSIIELPFSDLTFLEIWSKNDLPVHFIHSTYEDPPPFYVGQLTSNNICQPTMLRYWMPPGWPPELWCRTVMGLSELARPDDDELCGICYKLNSFAPPPPSALNACLNFVIFIAIEYQAPDLWKFKSVKRGSF